MTDSDCRRPFQKQLHVKDRPEIQRDEPEACFFLLLQLAFSLFPLAPSIVVETLQLATSLLHVESNLPLLQFVLHLLIQGVKSESIASVHFDLIVSHFDVVSKLPPLLEHAYIFSLFNELITSINQLSVALLRLLTRSTSTRSPPTRVSLASPSPPLRSRAPSAKKRCRSSTPSLPPPSPPFSSGSSSSAGTC